MRFPTILSNSKLPNWILRIKEMSPDEKWHEVISQCHEMKNAGISDLLHVMLIPHILKACSHVSCNTGKCLHACLIKTTFDSLTSTGNSVISFYLKFGELKTTVSVFNSMRSRDLISWNVLIHGYLNCGALMQTLM